ncbi:MFS transporter [Dictyobacter aurantiacus]|uniref:2-ketogluconate transporter n=1 Tax=Dictyobacter aurantiacus TaxID=1936993 RepID=A0A401ZPL0_9CHLR|nr:MFS transporter [Dictyobacter aurantiacus]GCE08750.1 2-ketogluconate transporter [Dictyobacter aurantiacus]
MMKEQNVVAVNTEALPANRWARLMPLAFITYSLAYLDRANFSFGAAGGLEKTLGITSLISSWLGALFFLGYFFFQIPGANFAQRRSARMLVFWALIAWSILAALTGIITNVPLLMIDRFLLGVAESVVFPAMLVFLTHWFTKRERSRANTFLILGNPVTVLWMSVISGYLIQALGWQWMFILEGVPSLIWAFIWLKLADDWPRDAAWLSRPQAESVEKTLADEQQGLSQVKNYWAAFRTGRVILLALQYFFWSIGVYGFVLWLPSIIKAGSNLKLGVTGLLSALPYLLAAILMLVASYFSDRTLQRKLYVWPFLLVGAVAFMISYFAGPGNFWLAFLFLVIAGGCMYAPYGPFFAIVPEILPSNAAGESMALINGMGALGSFIGAFFVGWLNGITGGSGAGFIFMAASLILAVILTILVRMPKQRSLEVAPGDTVESQASRPA